MNFLDHIISKVGVGIIATIMGIGSLLGVSSPTQPAPSLVNFNHTRTSGIPQGQDTTNEPTGNKETQGGVNLPTNKIVKKAQEPKIERAFKFIRNPHLTRDNNTKSASSSRGQENKANETLTSPPLHLSASPVIPLQLKQDTNQNEEASKQQVENRAQNNLLQIKIEEFKQKANDLKSKADALLPTNSSVLEDMGNQYKQYKTDAEQAQQAALADKVKLDAVISELSGLQDQYNKLIGVAQNIEQTIKDETAKSGVPMNQSQLISAVQDRMKTGKIQEQLDNLTNQITSKTYMVSLLQDQYSISRQDAGDRADKLMTFSESAKTAYDNNKSLYEQYIQEYNDVQDSIAKYETLLK